MTIACLNMTPSASPHQGSSENNTVSRASSVCTPVRPSTIFLPGLDRLIGTGANHRPYKEPTTDGGVQDYYPAGRIAFNHGEPDGSSLPAVEGLRIVEVTPEEIVLRGRTTLGSANGRFDRRTGHGEINEYTKYYDRREFKGEPWIGGEEGEDIWQQWILECKPSAPAKF